MATFVVVHGAWSAGWAWKKMRPLLRECGHELFTPTHTGLGDRSHLAHPDIDLSLHISDVLAMLQFEDLREVILVGHSYGGMVATGVADQAHERISRIVYLDAFVPRNGQSLLGLAGETMRARARELASELGDGWRLPANPMPPDTSQVDIDWASSRRVMQPLKTFEQPIALTGAVDQLPRTYIYCTKAGPGDGFRQFAERAKTESGWNYEELDASHNPHITMPQALANLFNAIAHRP